MVDKKLLIDSPAEIARFLLECPKLDDVQKGEYFGDVWVSFLPPTINF